MFNNRMVKLFMLLCNIYLIFFFITEVGDVDFFFFKYSWKVITIRVPRVRYDSNTCRF